MKTLKILFGILMCFALLATLISFFTGTIDEETPEIIGHLILIGIIIIVIYISFKPSRNKTNSIEKE